MILKQIQDHFQSMILVIIALVFSVVSIPLLGSMFVPWFLTFIFLWQCDNDYYFTPLFIFVVALIFDFATGALLGLTPLLLLISGRLIYNNRFILRGQTLQIKWISFTIWAFLFILLQYIISAIAVMSFSNALPSLINFMLLSLTYPMFYKFDQWIEKHE